MFSLLESKGDIAKAQGTLDATLHREFSKRSVRDIGYPGGTNYDAKVATDGQYWFWPGNHDESSASNPRYLNWFGLYNEGGGLQISVEVNTAYEGRNDQVAGFFARDNSTGKVYLMHSGRVGGGTKGVTKAALLTWSGLQLVEAVDSSGGIREGVIVMPVEGSAATRAAIRYIGTIARFKLAVRAGEISSSEFQRKQKELNDFYTEARGRRTGTRKSEIDYLSRHGEVVDAINDWRRSSPMPKGARIVKSVLIDMGVACGLELIEVFEVKTSSARQDIYSAIGQLMVHGAAQNCRRVIVLPLKDAIARDLKESLQRLGIELLQFLLDENRVTIIADA